MFYARRLYSSGKHAHLYTNTIPAMIPVFLLASAVYLGLELTQLKLSHEKYMEEASRRIEALEAEIGVLQQKRAREQPQAAASSTMWRWNKP